MTILQSKARFLNTLTTDDEYSFHNRENLQLPIQMQLSKKPKTFCVNFVAFLESTLNFKHFEKEHDPHSLSISENIDSSLERRSDLKMHKSF